MNSRKSYEFDNSRLQELEKKPFAEMNGEERQEFSNLRILEAANHEGINGTNRWLADKIIEERKEKVAKILA